MNDVLRMENVSVTLPSNGRVLTVLHDITLQIAEGRTLALVGESGCGKTMLGLSILRLLPEGARVSSGRVWLGESELTACGEEELRSVRGARIGMIFQEPMSALNPVFSCGYQVFEVLERHRPSSRRQLRSDVLGLLSRVGFSDPATVYESYPHELSGGMRQRVMIAMAIACRPCLVIADEPTTALDVTVQAQILHLLKEFQNKYPLSLLLITHDFGVVSQMADEVAVMYAGRVVEWGMVDDVLNSPMHPYTQGLIEALPSPDIRQPVLTTLPGSVPALGDLPSGCAFSTRCALVEDRCRAEVPALENVAERRVACWCVSR